MAPRDLGFPEAPSKKGLQVEDVDDALALGVRHATFNFNLAQLVDVEGTAGGPSLELDGERYHFEPGYIEHMDRQIAALSSRGVLVYLIVLAYQSPSAKVNEVLLHPGYSEAAPNRLGAFNTETETGRRWLRAVFSFIAGRWSGGANDTGRVVGYILGNEVNSHWWWSHRGRVSMEDFAGDYLRALRIAHAAIRSRSSWARLYVSLEHHWTIRYPAGDAMQAFPGRDFLEYLARKGREEGDFDWHVAFHPYPEDLFEPRFWQDGSARPTVDTPRITFKNIEVLTDFLRRPEMLHEGRPRRVILSEQGFHTPAGDDGQRIQAAAYCIAYKKIEALDGVDAFILHRHVDHPHEGGLLLGLRTLRPAAEKKRIYECFRVADTPAWRATFDFALPLAGFESWAAVRARSREAMPRPGSRVVVLGDSNTFAGGYVARLDAHYRLAGRAVELLNLGLPSETACGLSEPDHPFPRPDVHERLARVLAKSKPDLVVACYGMNDGIYHPFSEERFTAYRRGIDRLVEKVAAAGAPLVLLTPPPFDPLPMRKEGKLRPQDAEEGFAWFGAYENYDSVLARYSEWLLAQRERVALVVDIRTPLLSYLAERRETDPDYAMSGDGVHFDGDGHALIADVLLRAWGEEPVELPEDALAAATARMEILRDAWLTHTGHQRPGMKAGLPLAEAEARAAEVVRGFGKR